MKTLLSILALCVSVSVWAQSGNQTLPEIILKDVNGKAVNVADYSKNGKITIISFWATWCTPCKKELTNLNDLLEDWQQKYDVVLVGVTVDDAKNVPKVKPYVNGQAWEFDILLDQNRDLARALNCTAPPFTILLDQNGHIVYTHLGYTEGDEFTLEEKIKTLVAKK